MPKQEFVVATTGAGQALFLIGYNQQDPPSSTFGNLENAIIFDTLAEAESKAEVINAGTVGTIKPH